jgi:hypothetical protein
MRSVCYFVEDRLLFDGFVELHRIWVSLSLLLFSNSKNELIC